MPGTKETTKAKPKAPKTRAPKASKITLPEGVNNVVSAEVMQNLKARNVLRTESFRLHAGFDKTYVLSKVEPQTFGDAKNPNGFVAHYKEHNGSKTIVLPDYMLLQARLVDGAATVNGFSAEDLEAMGAETAPISNVGYREANAELLSFSPLSSKAEYDDDGKLKEFQVPKAIQIKGALVRKFEVEEEDYFPAIPLRMFKGYDEALAAYKKDLLEAAGDNIEEQKRAERAFLRRDSFLEYYNKGKKKSEQINTLELNNEKLKTTPSAWNNELLVTDPLTK